MPIIFPLLPQSKQRARQIRRAYYTSLASPVQTEQGRSDVPIIFPLLPQSKQRARRSDVPIILPLLPQSKQRARQIRRASPVQTESKVDQTCLLYFPCFPSPNREQGRSDVPIILPLLPQSKQRARQIRRAYYISLASPVQTESKVDQTCLLYFPCFLSPNREQGRSDVPIIFPLLPQSKQRARQIRRAYYISLASPVQTESKADQTCLLYFPCFPSPNREQGRSDVPIIFPLLPQSKQRARQIRRAYYIPLLPQSKQRASRSDVPIIFPLLPQPNREQADQTCLLYFPCFPSPNREQGRSDVPIIFPLLPQSKQRARQIRRAYYISLASPVQTESKSDQTCLLYFPCFPSPNREQGRSDVPIIFPLLPQSKQRARQIRRAYYISLASPVQTESKADQTCLLYFPCFPSPNREQGRSDVPIIFPLLPQSKQRARQIRRAYYISLASPVQTESKADQTCLLYFPCFPSPNREQGRSDVPIIFPLLPLSKQRARQIRRAYYTSLASPVQTESKADQTCLLYFPCFPSPNREQGRSDVPIIFPLLPQSKQRARQIRRAYYISLASPVQTESKADQTCLLYFPCFPSPNREQRADVPIIFPLLLQSKQRASQIRRAYYISLASQSKQRARQIRRAYYIIPLLQSQSQTESKVRSETCFPLLDFPFPCFQSKQRARQIRRAYYISLASPVQTESKADQTCLLYFPCFPSPNREQGRSDVPIIFPLLPQSKQRARQIRRAYYISLASPGQTESPVQTESKADQTCLLYFPCFPSPNREQGRSDVPIIFPLLPQSKQRARQIRRAYYISLASPVQTESKADQTCLLYFPCFPSPNREQGRSDVPIIFPLLPQSKQRARQIRRAYYISLASPVQTESKADQTCLLYFPCFPSPNREQGRSDVPIIFPLLPQSKQRARQIRRAYYISLASPVQTESKADQTCLLYFPCFPSPNREQGRSDVPIIFPLLPQSKQRARQIRRAYYISLASPVQTESKADQTCLLYFPCFSSPNREQGRSDVPIIFPLLPSPNREQGRSDVPIIFPLLPQSKQRARQIRRAYYISLASPVQTESKADQTCLLYFPCFPSPNREQGRSDVPIIFPLLPQSKQRARQIRRAYYISLASPVQRARQIRRAYYISLASPVQTERKQIRRAYYISLASPVQTGSKADQTCLLYFHCSPVQTESKADQTCLLYFHCFPSPNREQG